VIFKLHCSFQGNSLWFNYFELLVQFELPSRWIAPRGTILGCLLTIFHVMVKEYVHTLKLKPLP
jgi:hypothetical protein